MNQEIIKENAEGAWKMLQRWVDAREQLALTFTRGEAQAGVQSRSRVMNEPGRNSRSPDFVLEQSLKLWFGAFVIFRDSKPKKLIRNIISKKNIVELVIKVSDFIYISFIIIAETRWSGQQPFDMLIEVCILVHAYRECRFSRSTRIYVTPFSS